MAYRSNTEKLLKSRIEELERAVEAKPKTRPLFNNHYDHLVVLMVIAAIMFVFTVGMIVGSEAEQREHPAAETLPRLEENNELLGANNQSNMLYSIHDE